MPTYLNDHVISGSIIHDTTIGVLFPSTGYFNTLTVNGTGVSLSGHKHDFIDINNFSNGLSGLSLLGNIPSGIYIYSTGLNQFTTGVITTFARSILDDTSVSDVRTTLGLQSLSTVSGVLVLGSDVAQDIILSNINGSGTVFNNLNKNIDLIVKGSGSSDVFFYDASLGRLGINTTAPDASLHVVNDCALDGLKLESQSNCATGVHIFMIHRPQTAPTSGSFPCTISLAGRDYNDNVINYGRIRSVAAGTATGATSGELLFYIDKNTIDMLALRLANNEYELGTNNTISSGSASYSAIGDNNTINGIRFIVIGNSNTVDPARDSITVGFRNEDNANFNNIIGRDIVVNNSGNNIYGYKGVVSGVSGLFYGSVIYSTGNNSINIGSTINNSGSDCNLIGNRVTNIGNNTSILGYNISSNSNNAINIGNNLVSIGNSGIIIGNNSSTTGNNNILFGNNIRAVSTGLAAIGVNIITNNVIDSIITEQNVSIDNASGIVIYGRGNSLTSTNNVTTIQGYKNIARNTIEYSTIVGDSNQISSASGSILLGTSHFHSGTLKNNISLGRNNYLLGNSVNNIQIGSLNNQSGIKVSNVGLLSGSAVNNTNTLIHSIYIGTQNYSNSGNCVVVVGNKNYVNNNFGTVFGTLNTVIGSNDSVVIGRTNYTIGENNIHLGNRYNILGSNIINIGSANSESFIFGNNSINIGDSSFVADSLSVGRSNTVYGVKNTIVGSYNSIGAERFPFTATVTSNTFDTLSIAGNSVSSLAAGNELLIYVYNNLSPGNDSSYISTRTVDTATYDGDTNTSSILLTTNISVSSNYRKLFYTFDEGLGLGSAAIASGYVVLKNKTSYNTIYGDNNTVSNSGYSSTILGHYGKNLIIGSGNNVNGQRNIVVGHNLAVTNNNSVTIGSQNTYRTVFGQDIIYNTGQGCKKLIIKNNNNEIGLSYDMDNEVLSVGVDGADVNNIGTTINTSGIIKSLGLQLYPTTSVTPGDVLVATNTVGNTSWTTPFSVSGSNGRFLYKTSATKATGIEFFGFKFLNNGSPEFTFYNYNPDGILTAEDYVSGCTIVPNVGMTVNPNFCYDDEEFNLTIIGSGDADPGPTLFTTNYVTNQITMRQIHVTGSVNIRNNLVVSGSITNPSNTVGSLLRTNPSTYKLESYSPPAYSIITNTSSSLASGYKQFRYYPSTGLLLSAAPTINLTDSVVLDRYDVVLSNNPNVDTTFNRTARDGAFSVLYQFSNNTNEEASYTPSGTRGFLIDYGLSRVGINTTSGELSSFSGGTENGNVFVVNGKMYTRGIQLGQATVSGYVLTAINTSGNLDLRPLSISLLANSVDYPIRLYTSNGVDRLGLTTTNSNTNSTFNSENDRGSIIAWESSASGWVTPAHFKVPNNSGCILFGSGAYSNYLGTRNIHAFGGAPFNTTQDDYRGSSQYVQYYLRTKTLTDGVAKYLTTDWTANNTTTPTNNNIIIMPDHGSTTTACWGVDMTISAITKSGTGGGAVYPACVWFLNFGVKRGANGTSQIIGSVSKTEKRDANFPAEADVEVDLNTDRKINIKVSGINNYNIYYSATARVNQLTLPAWND